MRMTTEDRSATLRRLKNVEGHVRGIARMIEDDAYCIDVLMQIRAVQAALDRVAEHTLRDHLDHCVVEAVRGDSPDDRERVLSEILTVFTRTSR